MNKTELINYLNTYLKVSDFEDCCVNWLQVDCGKTQINKIWYAVDLSTYLVEKAVENKVDMMMVHHGIFWDYKTLTSTLYQRTKNLIKNDICLYWCHLPLDAHSVLWNNAVLKNKFIEYFKIENPQIEEILEINSQKIWFWIKSFSPIPVSQLPNFCESIWIEYNLVNSWNLKELTSIAICSWGAGSVVEEVKLLDYDLLLTWEAKHSNLVKSKEIWQPILLWGHYETEIFWVQELSKHLNEKFGIEIIFLDEKY